MASNVGFWLEDEIIEQIVSLQGRYAVVESPPFNREKFTKSEICRKAVEFGLAKLESECKAAEGRSGD
jgi:hypothetical protein